MPDKMPHSELTRLLLQFKLNMAREISNFTDAMILQTGGGVNEEGGLMVKPNDQGLASEPLIDNWKNAAAGGSNQASDTAEVKSTIRKPTGFVWSAKSKAEMNGVRGELVECANLALIYYTTIDFMCYDGLRTLAEQKRHVANGTSKTLKSKHLDGLAIDLVPIINGVPTWDWNGCYRIAHAMDQAATELGIADKIRWGGAWDRTLADFGGGIEQYQHETEAYAIRMKGKPFLDGPHFEWIG